MKRIYLGICGKTDGNDGFLIEKEADFCFTERLVKQLKELGYEVKVGRYCPPYHDTLERYLECKRYQPDGILEFHSKESPGVSVFYRGMEAKEMAEKIEKNLRKKGVRAEVKEKKSHSLSYDCPVYLVVEGEFHKEEVLEGILEMFCEEQVYKN
ncbi:MAG: N-acetylmuramoyl-L-alanine amidase [Lachnospiraceae bacterium]|nr:N-acetylmuramoyl-L-alanine amidase [Lachnospiraceae bacterium]